MKECEKRWSKKNHVTPQEKNIYMWGWKEALEWVLIEGIDDWLEDTIKEELNGKT